ncbi:UvrD-helicase domain-containing protein [Natrialba sp. INN-245]|uniref:UvrD-helicase domain-containing protein n=1 Tax=Natrialba sp. INN-245 TaxID=2690967 RepID=UPI001311A9E8|nr:UvrD-helicase domain-containing protein [Natrialba sp. INN-245]MWV40840.1 AAA family ATPase [Natrialba sp. INN-245]
MVWKGVEAKLDDERHGLLWRLLPSWAHERLGGSVAERRERHERRRAAVEAEFDAVVSSVESLACRTTIASRSTDAGIQSLDVERERDAVAAELERARHELNGFLTSRPADDGDYVARDYLSVDELHELATLDRHLHRSRTFLDAKSAYDSWIADFAPAYEAFRADTQPLLEYQTYLDRVTRREIDSRLATLSADVEAFTAEHDASVLPESDRERLASIRETLRQVEAHLEGYNERFVDRQCREYDALFSDIDDAGNDLNREQRVAIVRDDVCNQVVAAAGTGKTLALVYRVAYLVAEGTPPHRIVALTYTREAAREMEQRLEAEFGITDADVRTIHSFAYEIAREAAGDHLDVADRQDLYNVVDTVLREELDTNSTFDEHYTRFLFHYDHTDPGETAFDSKAEYVAARRDETYTTLCGEDVESRAERVIADFLFTHRVDYQYESIAAWADSDPQKGEYRPDFYLPEYDLYIEHWGIDEAGTVAPWFTWSTDEYREKLAWARDQFHATCDYDLIETYEFEHDAGLLERGLEYRLLEAGVDLDPMSFEEFVDETVAYNERERDIKESLVSFVQNAKTFGLDPEDIRRRLTRRKPRQYHFGRCGAIVLERYNAHLSESGLVDFDDMIHEAIDAVDANPEAFREQFDHLLVDEFQDVSADQIELIERLVGSNGDVHLFCVGDDWQSIYSFQGAEVEYFVEFDEHVMPATRTRLVKNYRCPEPVLEAGNALIGENPSQIDKQVVAESGRDTEPQLHVLDGYTQEAYERRVGQYTADLVEEAIASGHEPGDVMVLCRYDAGAPFTDRIKAELERRDIPYDGKGDETYRPDSMSGRFDREFDPDAGASVFSVHQAKGRQAGCVILANVATGAYGFPAEKRDDSLLEPVQPIRTNTRAEERRLLYVALTRTQDQLHVLTRRGHRSPFLDKISEYVDERSVVAALHPEDEQDELTTMTAKVKLLWDDLHDTQHQAGVLEDRSGTIRFVSWANEDPPMVDEGAWYPLENVEIGTFDDEPQVTIRSDTTVTRLYTEDGA